MSTKSTSVFKDPEVAEILSTIEDKYFAVPVDKPPSNNVLFYKELNIDCTKIG